MVYVFVEGLDSRWFPRTSTSMILHTFSAKLSRIQGLVFWVLILGVSGCVLGEREVTQPEVWPHVLRIGNGEIELGVLLQAGGRAVLLREKGGKNLLLSDPSWWENPEETFARPEDEIRFYPVHGHTIWHGPQDGFWSQQTVDPERAGRNWPPDPWAEYGRYEVVTHTADSIVLQGPPSPVTGLAMRKSYRVHAEGLIELKVSAENTRDEEVTWNFWSLTRFSGDTPHYTPASARGIDTVETREIPHRIMSGYFTFVPEIADPGNTASVSNKAFLTPDEPWIAAFPGGEHLFLKSFPNVSMDELPRGHSPVEIYQLLPGPEQPGLLELEAHSPLRTLRPGERMRWTETWRVLPYDGENEPDAHMHFLSILPSLTGKHRAHPRIGDKS